MRVIGGEFRGKKLALLGEGDLNAHLRPSTDRYRESLFNILNQPRYEYAPDGLRILDLFAGTGALGIEALSRGADYGAFVDNGIAARGMIRQNLNDFSLGARARLLRRDATDLGDAIDGRFDLVFMDPPYGQGLGERAITSAKNGGWLSSHALVIWEDDRAIAVPSWLTVLDERKIGRAWLRILRMRE